MRLGRRCLTSKDTERLDFKISQIDIRWHVLKQMFVLNELHWSDVELRADQYAAHYPKTIYGYLAHALLLRKILGLKPWTILSCDNVPSNGELLK